MNYGSESKIVVCEEANERPNREALTCLIHRDLSVNYKRLAQYCWAVPDFVDIDLLVVAGACAYADRAVRRKRGTLWSRHLQLSIPVHECERWGSADVKGRLEEALNYLTGDFWEFDFRKRRIHDGQVRQLELLARSFGPCCVLAYSGGLDSFAQVRLELRDRPDRTPLLITTEQGAVHSLVDSTLQGETLHHVGIPLAAHIGEHAEPTNRSRMFVFLSSAAVAWRLSRAEEIVLAEPGQGAVGPSIVPFGDEHPYRGSHPGFSTRFSSFIQALWGTSPRISHPNLWKTKGQVLREIQSRNALHGWERTSSCSRNVSRQKGAGSPEHCGICGGCLLRRLSIASLGDGESGKEAYYWEDLDAVDVAASSLAPSAGRTQTGNADLEVAVMAVLDLANLARAADFPADHPDIVRSSLELAEALRMDTSAVRTQMGILLTTHKAEWADFLGRRSSRSWLVQLAQEK